MTKTKSNIRKHIAEIIEAGVSYALSYEVIAERVISELDNKKVAIKALQALKLAHTNKITKPQLARAISEIEEALS